MRITEKTLVGLAGTLNTLTYRSNASWKRLDKPDEKQRQMHAQVGNIHISPGNGYYNVYEMSSIGGAVRELFSGRAAECYAYLRGRLDALSDERLVLALVHAIEQNSPRELRSMQETLESFADRAGSNLLRGRVANMLSHLLYKVWR